MAQHPKSDIEVPVQEKPDWMISKLQGKLPGTLGELHEGGLTANQFSIGTADDYWAKDSVKQAFTDKNGEQLRSEFDKYYVDTTNEFKKNLESEYLTYKSEIQFSGEYAKKLNNPLRRPNVSAVAPDLNGKFFNSNMPDGAKIGNPRFGAREIAIRNNVHLDDGSITTVENYQDANENGFSDDFSNMLKFAKDENGQFKLDEAGRSYMVPVKNGEKLKTYDEVYNGFNDIFGRYGVGNGFWSGVSATLIALPKGGINFFASAIDGLAVMGQAISEPLAGKDSAANKFFINTQNTMAGAKIASTDKGLNDWTSYEGIVDMGVSVAFQLLGLITGTGALRSIGTGAKAASRISRLGMSSMAGAPIYDVSKESGLSTAEASLLYAVGMAGFYGLAGADTLLVNSMMGKTAAPSVTMLKDVFQNAMKISTKGNFLTKGGIKAFRYNASNGLRNLMQLARQTKAGGLAGSTLLEAGQETSEQVFDTLLRTSFNQYSELRDAGLTDKDKGGKFIIDWDNEIQSWKQAAVGGALGGAIAGGPMRRFMGNNQPNDMLADFTRSIIDGREGEIFAMIDKMEAEDMFAEGFLTSDGKITGDPSKSKNAEAATIVREQVRSLVKLRDSSAMQDFTVNRIAEMKSKLTGLDKVLASVGIGNKESAKDAQTSILQMVGGIFDPKVETDKLYDNFTTAGRDAASLMLNIDALKANKLETNNVEETADLQDIIDKAESRLSKLKKGEFTDEYLTQGIYNIRALTNVEPLGLMSRAINGKSFVNLNNNFKNQSKNALDKYNTELEAQQEADATATEDSFEGASKQIIDGFIDDNIIKLEAVSEAIKVKINSTGDIDAIIEDIEVGVLGEGVDLTSELTAYDEIAGRLATLNAATPIETIAPLTLEDARGVELATLLNSTQDIDERIGLTELDESTTEGLVDLFNKEVSAFQAAVENGDNYTNVEALITLQNSLEKRTAQIQNILELQGLPTVPNITENEANSLLQLTTSMLGEVNKLQIIAEDNLNNPQGAINENALNLLNTKINTIINIGNKLGESIEYIPLSETIGKHLANLTQAHENGDITAFMQALNVFENDLYNQVKNYPNPDIDAILAKLNPLSIDNKSADAQGDEDTSIDKQEYAIYKSNYDYLAGVLNISSENLYSAYYAAINESNQQGISPSIEQRIVIYDAVRGVMNSTYNPLFPWDLNVAETGPDSYAGKLSDSVYIDGAGGTGKTAIVMNAVAATVSKLNGEGEVFFTSVDGGGRISNLNEQANQFGGIAIRQINNVFTIKQLFENTENLDGLSAIVFDEATLISTAEFREYANIINAYNKGKISGRIKIIYGGDSFQNNVDTIETSNQSGVNNIGKMLLPRTPRLDFSFRSQNHDLKTLATTLQIAQAQLNIPKTGIILNNDKGTGVRIVHNKDQFDAQVLKFIETLGETESQKTVYITDRDDINVEIANAGIAVMNSQQAQGQEWDNVIVDFIESPYKLNSYNYKAKQEYYTAVTRAKKFLLMSLPDGQQIRSQKGKVYEINPARLENATKQNELSNLDEITGGINNNIQQIINTLPNTINQPTGVAADVSKVAKLEQDLSNFFKNFKDGSVKLHTFFTTIPSTVSIQKSSSKTLRLNDLNEKAKKLGYAGIKQLNLQNFNGSTGETLILQQEYAKLDKEVRELKDVESISNLPKELFDDWEYTAKPTLGISGITQDSNNLTRAEIHYNNLIARGDKVKAKEALININISKRNENQTLNQFIETFGKDHKDANQIYIDAINKSAREYNKQLNEVLNRIKKITPIKNTSNLDKVFDLKRKLIYGNYDTISTDYGYRIVLAQIGSPEYQNVVRNDPKFNGKYALFLEGFAKNPQQGDIVSTVIGSIGGTEQAPDFNRQLSNLIQENNVFADGSTVKSMEISKSVFSADKVTGGFRDGKTKVSITQLKENSPGINFGKVFIFEKSITGVNGNRIARAGQAFIPASFSLTQEQINNKLSNFSGDATALIQDTDIIPVYIDGKTNSYQDIAIELEKFLEEYPTGKDGTTERLFPRTLNAEGKYFPSKNAFSYSSPLGVAYGAFIARHTVSGKFSGESTFNRALQQVYEDNLTTPDSDYLKFLKRWANAAVEDTNIRNQYSEQKVVSKNRDSTRPYFLFRDYVEAKANNRSDTALYERLLDDIINSKVEVSRKSSSGENIVESVPLFKNGFEYSVIADKNVSANTFLESVDADNDLLNANTITVDANFVSSPSINLNINGLVEGLLSTLSSNIPTSIVPNSDIADSNVKKEDTQTNGATQEPLQDVDMSGDGASITYVDPIDVKVFNEDFDYNKGLVLNDFQKLYYADSNVNRMQRGIDQFKHGIWNSIFKTVGSTPIMANATQAINSYRSKVDSIKINGNSSNQALITDENEHYWHDAVASSAFDFLMEMNFPALKPIVDSNGKVTYVARVSSYKAKSYDDTGKSLLDNTANEMVKTMLFNTPELFIKDGQIGITGRFLNKNDIEDALGIFKDNLTTEDIIATMEAAIADNSINPVNSVVLSMYYQYYSNTPYELGGQNNHSLRSIANSETPFKMVEALSAFMRTGSVSKYAHVNISGTSASFKGRPNPSGGKPNLIRTILLDSVIENSTALQPRLSKDSKSNIISLTALNGDVTTIHPDGSSSEFDLLNIFNEVGISRFNKSVLDELIKLRDESPVNINSTLNNIAYNILNRTLQGGDLTLENKRAFFQQMLTPEFTEYIAKPISVNDNILTELSYINLNGDKVNRLRDRTPINSVNLIIDSINNTSNSVYGENLFANGTFQIQDIVTKDGFKYFNKGFSKSKNHKKFLESETAEYDIIWGFADSIKALKPDSNAFSYAIFSPLVYSDGSTDLTPVVKLTKEQISNPESTLKALYASQKNSYTKIKQLVETKKYPIADMNNNPVYKENLALYVDGSEAEFIKYARKQADELIAGLDNTVKSKMPTEITGFNLNSRENIITSFYYNWLAVSTEFSDITVGKLANFEGKDHSTKYVDLAKRAKMMAANRSGMLFRNASWASEVTTFRTNNPNTPLPERMILEGMKLSQFGKVIYVTDIVKTFSTLDMSRVDTKQKVLDGATFTNPLTRIFQRASAGGDFGTKIPTVAKPITNSFDPVTGVGTGIKNAEFEITARILRTGTPLVRKMMNNMLTPQVKQMLISIVEGRVNTNTDTGNVSSISIEDVYDVVEQSDFNLLARNVVEQGLQDEIIHEIIPKSSRKYGKTAANNIEDETYSTDLIDFSNKGQQLDASHNVSTNSELNMVSQFLSSVGTNYRNPTEVKTIYGAINELIQNEVDNWSGDIDVQDKLSRAVKDAINKRVGVSYQHNLVNSGEYSFNDKQIYKVVASQLNSILTNNGIKIKLFGGQYVLHPQSSIIGLSRDASGRVYLNDEIPPGVEIPKGNTNVDLQWASPVHESGDRLEDYPPYVKLRDVYTADLKAGKGGKKLLAAFQAEVDKILSTSEWNAGMGEMLIPISIAKQFNLNERDLNIPINDYNAEFFTAKLLANPKNKLTSEQAAEKGDAQAADFRKSLVMLNIRIPTTGKHSGVVLKAVGFVNSSANSVFVPPMLLFVQGADHDIDKGNLTGLKAINGIIPLLDENLQLDERTKKWFPKGLTPKQRHIALTNTISRGMMEISASPTNVIEGNSAVDSLLDDMQALLKPSDKVIHNKNSYLSFIKLRRDNQAGKALVGVFANAQKAYLTLDAFSSVNNKDMGLPVKQGRDTISETFAALINAATDNAKAQILGPLGIDSTNASIVSFMVMQGFSLDKIVQTLKDNSEDFDTIRQASYYENFGVDVKELSPDIQQLYKSGQQLSLISQSILNTKLPNSAYDNFKYGFRISKSVSSVLGKPFDFNTFINGTAENAQNVINDYQNAIDNNKADFNILELLNPYNTNHPVNSYVKLYKKSTEILNAQVPVIKLINNVATSYANKYSKDSLQDTTYESITNYVYGLAVSDFFSSKKFTDNKGVKENLSLDEINLSTAIGRTKWVDDFNTNVLPALKRKYSGENENLFIQTLRPIPIEKYNYRKDAVTYGLPDLRNVEESKILQYDVSFNNKELLDDADKTKLLTYSLITTGGKPGKGSFAQLFRHDEPMIKAFNNHLDKFVEFDFNVETLATGFNIANENDRPNAAELLPNALPYEQIESVEIEDRGDKKVLTFDRTNTTDDILSGQYSALSVTDAQLSRNKSLSAAVDIFNKTKAPVTSRMILENNNSSGQVILTYHGKVESDINADKFVRGYPKKSGNHLFTVEVAGLVKMARFSPANPATYIFTENGDVSIAHKKVINKHITGLILEANVDKIATYLEDFGLNSGLMYNQSRIRILGKLPQVKDYMIGFGKIAQDRIKTSYLANNVQTPSQIKEQLFEEITSRNNTKNLPKIGRGELVNNLNSYKSENELDFYLAKLYTGVNKLAAKDELLILDTASKWYEANRIENNSLTNLASNKDSIKKKSELKGNGRARITMSQIGGLISSYENVNADNKAVIDRIMTRLTANVRRSDATKVGKKLKELGVDIPVINAFLGTNFKVKGEDAVRRSKRKDILISKKEASRFSNILADFGYNIEVDANISFDDTIKDTGESIIDSLRSLAVDQSIDDADRAFAQNLVSQYDSPKRFISDNEINDISRVCGK